jgi:hypothetical protein
MSSTSDKPSLSQRATRALWVIAGLFCVTFFPTYLFRSPVTGMVLSVVAMILIGLRCRTLGQALLRGILLGVVCGATLTMAMNNVRFRQGAENLMSGRAQTKPVSTAPASQPSTATAPASQPEILPGTAWVLEDREAKLYFFPTFGMCTVVTVLFAHIAIKKRRDLATPWE